MMIGVGLINMLHNRSKFLLVTVVALALVTAWPASGFGQTRAIPVVVLSDAVQGRLYRTAIPLQQSIGLVTTRIIQGELPDGLLARSIWIEGTPAKVGVFTFTLEAGDEAGQIANQNFKIEVVSPPAPPLVIKNSNLTAAILGQTYGVSLVSVGGNPPYDWRVTNGRLPRWCTLQDGVLRGTPDHTDFQGSSTFTLEVRDEAGNRDESGEWTLTVRPNPTCPPPGILTTSCPTAIVGRTYHLELAVSGNKDGLQVDHVGGQLPPGLELSAEGLMQGLPELPGNWSFDIQATDRLGQVSEQATIGIRVVDWQGKPLAWQDIQLPTLVVGRDYELVLPVSGGTQPFNFKASAPWPPGLSFGSEDGSIQGRPETVGCWDILVLVSDQSDQPNTVESMVRLQVIEEAQPSIQDSPRFYFGLVVGMGMALAFWFIAFLVRWYSAKKKAPHQK